MVFRTVATTALIPYETRRRPTNRMEGGLGGRSQEPSTSLFSFNCALALVPALTVPLTRSTLLV